ncbi:MAG: RNA polymerase sporulation sigma factor SigE [Clostridiaceae bacterium]|nr:RNA polymerase sporulation sigma factor SigE [Clostridiaceae bacterium]
MKNREPGRKETRNEKKTVKFKKAKLCKFILHVKYVQVLNSLGLCPRQPIYYIGGSEALPPPLTDDEENYLLEQLDNSDYGVKKILIERNLRLVVYIARKFENTGVGVEDLVSIGTIGLIKAINTFKPSKNIKLATYASRCIENEILMYLRRNNKTKTEISIDEPLNTDWDGNELLLSDILGTDSDVIHRSIEDEVDKELLNQALKKLSSREKRIMELRFGLINGVEKTQKEVADMLGISQSYISRLEKRIIGRLRKEINRMV